MIDNKYIRVGQIFKGLVDGSKIQIIDITNIHYLYNKFDFFKTPYIKTKDLASGYIDVTNKRHFQTLLFKPIKFRRIKN